MKKTLFRLLLLYFLIILLGFFFRTFFFGEQMSSEYLTKASARKSEMLKNDFLREDDSDDSQLSLDMLKSTTHELISRDGIIGGGAYAETGDLITINYTAMFEDGTVFDSSKKPGRDPFQFKLGAGQVIKGLDEGIVGMRVGGERTLIVPASKAYGLKRYGSIPAGSTLIYTIELLSVFDR